MMGNCDSILTQLRLEYQPPVPKALADLKNLVMQPADQKTNLDPSVKQLFPHTHHLPHLALTTGTSAMPHLRIGVLFSGGQAPGGHNVVAGLFDYLSELNHRSALIGFLGGPSGLLKGSYIPLTAPLIDQYRNQGGFDLLGSGRTKIDTPAQFAIAADVVKQLTLDGLVIIGGDDSNTNAALLAEYFAANNIPTKVVGVPKTIDGDLKNARIDTSFGFDTATKVYSDLIGNICRDALSAKKYYHFIKLMGRTASHIALECALRTHPNAVLIGEEIAESQKSVEDIVSDLSNLICQRAASGKEYGVILIPEGLLEYIPSYKSLIAELNHLLSPGQFDSTALDKLPTNKEKLDLMANFLTHNSKRSFQALPEQIQLQLILDRDPHGNIQVSQIETERLLIDMISTELQKRTANGKFSGTFRPLPHFFGYEGRSCLPSNFDAKYCYSLGTVAGILIASGASGYMACIKNLAASTDAWEPMGIPLVSMIALEQRSGKTKAVINKSIIDLHAAPFNLLKEKRGAWAINDEYSYPGPIQFFGPDYLTESTSFTLQLENGLSIGDLNLISLSAAKGFAL
jgi:pyrophosphate--fructose-6-phosphate 1-phosphotransferase